MATKTKVKNLKKVEVDEMMKINVMAKTGMSKRSIMKETGRGYRAVSSAIKNFNAILPDEHDLKKSLDENLEMVVERLAQNSATLIFAADQQTARKLHEADALSAARISDIHLKRLNGTKNMAPGLNDEAEGKTVRVMNFINNVFNIVKNDRPKTIPGTGSGIASDEHKGKASCIEGALS